MANKIKKSDYDKLAAKRDDLLSKRNNTHDPHARISLTKKFDKLDSFLKQVEIVL